MDRATFTFWLDIITKVALLFVLLTLLFFWWMPHPDHGLPSDAHPAHPIYLPDDTVPPETGTAPPHPAHPIWLECNPVPAPTHK